MANYFDLALALLQSARRRRRRRCHHHNPRPSILEALHLMKTTRWIKKLHSTTTFQKARTMWKSFSLKHRAAPATILPHLPSVGRGRLGKGSRKIYSDADDAAAQGDIGPEPGTQISRGGVGLFLSLCSLAKIVLGPAAHAHAAAPLYAIHAAIRYTCPRLPALVPLPLPIRL